MRLIDADAITNRIVDELRTNGTFDELNGRQAANLIGRAIDEAPTIGGWISVKDRMPQDETEVVILVQHRIGWYRALAWHDEFGWHSSAEEFVDGESESDYVTHWMPLPEPPEEVTGDAEL